MSRFFLLNVIVFIFFTLFICFSFLKTTKTEEKPNNEITLYNTDYIFPFSSDELLCMARNIFFEAGGESDLGKYAVAHITVNRVQHENWPKTICKVVYQHAQFSWTLDADLRNKVPNASNPKWQRSLQIAFDVLYNGKRVSVLDQSYFFHAHYVNPRWAAAKQPVTTIENHIFYRFRDI